MTRERRACYAVRICLMAMKGKGPAVIRKILKWIGIVLGSLVGLLVLAFIVLYIVGTAKWNKLHGNYDVPVETVLIPTNQASIAHGEHIATIRMCGDCHAEILSGGSETVPGLVTLTFPNLTAGAGGVGATNTDQDWVRAIRHGVGHDGRGLVIMPAGIFYYLSDEDLGELIAYLKTLPPVDNEMPPLNLGPLGRVMLALGEALFTGPDVIVIDHDGPRPVAPKPDVTVEYGEYLTHICTVCHGENFNGQTMEKGLVPNLTPGGEVAFWSEEEFMATLRTGITPGGHQLNDFMPWKYVGQMTDDELRAVWLYLQSLPALEQGK
jgi:mono/diheme cytochrome c family protein